MGKALGSFMNELLGVSCPRIDPTNVLIVCDNANSQISTTIPTDQMVRKSRSNMNLRRGSICMMDPARQMVKQSRSNVRPRRSSIVTVKPAHQMMKQSRSNMYPRRSSACITQKPTETFLSTEPRRTQSHSTALDLLRNGRRWQSEATESSLRNSLRRDLVKPKRQSSMDRKSKQKNKIQQPSLPRRTNHHLLSPKTNFERR